MTKVGTVDVIVLAGGHIPTPLAERTGAAHKALISLGKSTLIERVFDALHTMPHLGRVATVGPDAVLDVARRCGADALLPDQESPVLNTFRGFCWLREQPSAAAYTLMVPSDLPFLNRSALDALVSACYGRVDAGVPVMRLSDFLARFPGSEQFALRFADGEFTAGCVTMVRTEAVFAPAAMAQWPYMEKVYRSRRSQVTLALTLGPANVLRFLTHRLTFYHLEQFCDRRGHCTTRAIYGSDPVLAFDIDKVADYEYACQELARESGAEFARPKPAAPLTLQPDI